MNAEGIYATPPGIGGWRRLPCGNYVRLGENVRLGDGVRLGKNVWLGENVWLGQSPLVIQAPRHPVYPYAPGIVGVGCTQGALEWWREHAEALAREHDLDAAEYLGYVEMVAAWMEKHKPFEEPK